MHVFKSCACPHLEACCYWYCLQILDSICCGVQCQIGTHFFGHAYLTSLLLPTLKDSSPSRVVWTTSAAEAAGDVDWDNLAYISISAVHGCVALFAYALHAA